MLKSNQLALWKSIFIFALLNICILVNAQTIDIESPMGSFKMKVEQNEQDNYTQKSVVEEIGKRVEYLETHYLKKLSRTKKLKSKKIVDEIFELLEMLPGDVYVAVETEQKKKQKPQENSGLNININVNETEQNPVTPPPTTQPEVTQTEQVNTPMSETDFQKLLNNIESESFADDQLSVIRLAAKSHYFTVSQLKRMLQKFTFADDKISCVQIIYPKVTDKENAHNLLNSFEYSSDKKKVEQIISQ